MESCPDCTAVKEVYSNNSEYLLIDIGKQARNLKEFLALRDHHPAFIKVRQLGTIGIPCFVKEDGSVAISSKHFEAGLFIDASTMTETATPASNEDETTVPEGASCSLDGTGC